MKVYLEKFFKVGIVIQYAPNIIKEYVLIKENGPA